jgi:hypothetical protein
MVPAFDISILLGTQVVHNTRAHAFAGQPMPVSVMPPAEFDQVKLLLIL